MTPLIETTLFGKIDRVEMAIRRLREYEPPEGYYLAFSGGKDSVVLYELAKRAGVLFDAHYAVSGIDPPELVRFIKAEYPDVKWERNAPPFFTLLPVKGFPIRRGRWCCEKYKESGGHGRMVLTGVRWAESHRRASRMMVERCYSDPTRTYLHPIIDWLDADVWEFIRREEIPYCKLYDEGFKRLGCICCPMQSASLKRMELDRWPGFERAYRIAFRKLHANRMKTNPDAVSKWADGDNMFDWWISNEPLPSEDDDQCPLFT
jgi:phosphoadenosine phosphosulfate reductase